MAEQSSTNQPPARGHRWRLAGLALPVLALHAWGLAWWLDDAARRPAVAAQAPTHAEQPTAAGHAAGGWRVALREPAPEEAKPSPTLNANPTVPANLPEATPTRPSTPPHTPRNAAATAQGKKNQPKTGPAQFAQTFAATDIAFSAADQPAAAAKAIPWAPAAPAPLAPADGGADAAPAGQATVRPLHASAVVSQPEQNGTVSEGVANAPDASDQPNPVTRVATQGARARSQALPSPVEQATVARHLSVPPSTTLEYRVRASSKGLTLPADSTLTWQVQGGTYSASMVFQAMFGRSRSQTSVGDIDPALGLQPRRFGDKNRTEVATHFDRSRHPPAIRFSNNAPDLPLMASTQDRLSVLIQLAAMVAGEPKRYPPGQAVVLHTVSSRDADLWHFVVKNTEVLDLPIGPLETLHLAREALNAYDNRVEVWLAPSLGHLPVRILWTQANGDVVDQQLRAHQP